MGIVCCLLLIVRVLKPRCAKRPEASKKPVPRIGCVRFYENVVGSRYLMSSMKNVSVTAQNQPEIIVFATHTQPVAMHALGVGITGRVLGTGPFSRQSRVKLSRVQRGSSDGVAYIDSPQACLVQTLKNQWQPGGDSPFYNLFF